MKVLKQSLLILNTILVSFSLSAAVDNGPVIPGIKIQIERVGNMTHFEFQGQKEWNYDLKKNKNIISLTLPKLDTESVDRVETYQGFLINSIRVDASAKNKSLLKIELADQKVESFDYLTQEPSNLIVDFFVNNDAIIKRIKAKRKMAADQQKAGSPSGSVAKNSKRKKKKFTEVDRKPAFAEFVTIDDSKSAEGGLSDFGGSREPEGELLLKPAASLNELFDFGALSFKEDDSLEAKVIEARGNIYLRFPLLRLENKHLSELRRFKPEYEIKESFSDENKQARTLLALYQQRSYASFIKAKRLFKETFPESKYDEILSYLEADVWVELWRENNRVEYLTKAMNMYRMLIERYPNSRITERTLIYAGLLSHEVGEYFLATKMLKRYITNYPNSPFNSYIRIYLADALAHLNNFDRARTVLDKVVEDGEDGPMQEALYRIGDIYFLKQNYRRAERAYSKALEKHPKLAGSYPNALFNLAESHFILAEYPESLKTYKRFFDSYSTHPFSGYALTRIGEIIGILGGSPKRAQGFYNESFFRYRRTTGGALARMRSLSQRFKYMKDSELKHSVEEIKKLEKHVNLDQVDEFSAFMISDGYYARGDFMEAAKALTNYFQVNPKPVNIQKFERRISRAIAGDVRKLIQEGKVVKAMGIIESHQKSWLSKSRRVDVQFFRAMAYEKMGLYKEAMQSYERLEKRMKLLEGSKEETERKVFEYYPTADMVNLREAVSSYGLKRNKEALAHLKAVKDISKLDKGSKVDYFLTLSKISYDNKQYKEALKTVQLVNDNNIKDPEKKEKFNVYLSQVYERNEMFDKAQAILEDFYKKHKGERDQVYVLSRLFHLYRDKGMTDKAIETGDRLLAEYGTKYDLDKERYHLGELHYASQNSVEAEKVWKGLTKKSVWDELAKNRIESDTWKKKTDDSLKRIPAMAQ